MDETNDIEICNALWETKAFMYAMKEKVELIIELMSPLDKNISKPLKVSKKVIDKGLSTGYTINVTKNDINIKTEKIKNKDKDNN